MSKLLLVLALFAAPGCGAAALVLFGAVEADALVDNFEAGIEAQQLMTEYVMLIGRGEIDVASIEGAVYVAPSAENNWVGSLDVTGGTFPFGVGDFNLAFTSAGDGGPVDPLTTDLSDDVNVTIDADFGFIGRSLGDESLSATGTFDVTSIQNTVDDLDATIDGVFNLRHDGYEFDLVANQVDVGLDIIAGSLTDITGRLNGSVDIPNFAFDADFTLDGVGDAFHVAIDAAATTIGYTLNIF